MADEKDPKTDETPKGEDAPKDGEKPKGDDKPKADPSKEEKPKEDVITMTEKQLKERLERDRKTQAEKAERDRQKAEEKVMAERQEHEQLANARGERITALEKEVEELKATQTGDQDRRDSLMKAVEESVEAELKQISLPDWAAKLLEGMDVLERRKFLTEHREELTSVKPQAKGVPKTPQDKAAGGDSEPVPKEHQKATDTFYADNA